MKTRIISGIVMILILAAVLALGFTVSGWFITVFIALAAAGGVYELLKNAVGIKSKTALTGACVYSALTVVFSNDEFLVTVRGFIIGREAAAYSSLRPITTVQLVCMLTALYFIFAAVCCLALHKYFSVSHIAALCALPIPIAFAFSSLDFLVRAGGMYYLLLLLNFSSVCDMGAYFVGSTLGKHKLCPNISPKKTVEGAVGGIVSSLIVSVIIVLVFSEPERLVPTLIATVPLCILGMVGDLFASAIKRAAGIKDYGRLIPGHGGVLDRMDSILMIAPFFLLLVSIFVS